MQRFLLVVLLTLLCVVLAGGVFIACGKSAAPEKGGSGENNGDKNVDKNVDGAKPAENAADTAEKAETNEFVTNGNSQLEAIRSAFETLKSIKDPKTVDSFLVPFNEMEIKITRLGNHTSFYQSVHPNKGIRDASAQLEQELDKIRTAIKMSPEIFAALKALDLSKESDDTRFYVEKLLVEFKRAGLEKDEATREKIKALTEELLKVGQEFSRNISEDVRSIQLDSAEQLAGMPQDYIDAHQPGTDGKITITTNSPDLSPYLVYAQSDAKRKELSIVDLQRGHPANEPLLKKLIALRHQLALLLGYKNWAHYDTEIKMIGSGEAVDAFVNKVSAIAESGCKNDLKQLLERLKKEQPDAQTVGSWQSRYIAGLVKKEKYAFDTQQLRPYFPYETVKNGIFDITSQMYGVTIAKVDVPTYHSSVEVYDLLEGQRQIGRFYLDMHPRKDKYKHAMMTAVEPGIRDKQIPVAALVCNFPGGDGSAGLMEHDDVSTFFHEFGHLMHELLGGNQRWVGNTGITTEWDFVEVPSILFEEWAWDRDMLKRFAKNEKGETIPDELIDGLLKSRGFGVGLYTKQQMFYAAISLHFHFQNTDDFDQLALLKDLQTRYSPFEYLPDTYMHLSFGHLRDYAASYYTYMWSEVIARDIFSRFKAKGLLDNETATAYKTKILAPGGSQKAMHLIKNFLGRNYSFDAFQAYINEAEKVK